MVGGINLHACICIRSIQSLWSLAQKQENNSISYNLTSCTLAHPLLPVPSVASSYFGMIHVHGYITCMLIIICSGIDIIIYMEIGKYLCMA
jgi:hypothetical protein